MSTSNARLATGTVFILIAAGMNGIEAGTAAMHAILVVIGVILLLTSFAPESAR